MRNTTNYTIMNAGCLFDNKAITVGQAAEEWTNSTILVARRETGYDKFSSLFISGYGQGYEEEIALGDEVKSLYTQDTGMGHSNKNKTLIIENVIRVVNGKVVDSGNGIGVNEKRRVWVMK